MQEGDEEDINIVDDGSTLDDGEKKGKRATRAVNDDLSLTINHHTPSSPHPIHLSLYTGTRKFNRIIGALQSILVEPDFELARESFCRQELTVQSS